MSKFRSHRIVTGLVVAAALLLAGCGLAQEDPVPVTGPSAVTGPSPATDSFPATDPYRVTEPLPEVDVSELRLPEPFEKLRVVDPGWSTLPQYADGVFLAAIERSDALEFTAVDVHGDVLWAAQRPLSCTGFTITTDDTGTKLAILTNTQTTDTALAATTVTAYELTTGDQVWGPVDVPGPIQGPGLVFAPPGPDAAIGETGPRTVLDPNTGNIAITESNGAEQIVGEYHGTLLVTDKDSLIARSASDGDGDSDSDSDGDSQELWQISLAEHGWTQDTLRPSLHTSPGEELALIRTSASSGALLDLTDGTVISDTAVEAALDPASKTLVIRDENGLQAYDSQHQPLWALGATPQTTITALGGVLLYIRDGAAIRVHNVVTGEVAQGYDPNGQGRIVVPELITETGAALLVDGQHHLIASIDQLADADNSGTPD